MSSKKTKKKSVYRMVLAAMFLALALVLPLITGQLQQIGNALCPMHIPVILAGFFCGPWYAAIIGFIAPLLRFVIFGMPPIMPIGIAMSFELMTYGLITGLMYMALPKKKYSIYISLIVAMIAGRIIWGVARLVIFQLKGSEFSWAMFMSGAVLNAIPGIIIQIVIIPILVMALEKYTIKNNRL